MLSYDTKAEPRQLLQYWPCAQGHSPLPSGAHKAAFLCSGSTEGHVHDYVEKSRVGTRSFLCSYLVQAATNKYHHELSSSSVMESSTPFALCIRWHLPDTAGLHQFLCKQADTQNTELLVLLVCLGIPLMQILPLLPQQPVLDTTEE